MASVTQRMLLLEAEDLDQIAANFLAVMPPERHDRVKRALGIIMPAYKAGAIYNAEFQDLKTSLDRSFEMAYDALTDISAGTYWNDPKDTSKGISVRGQVRDELGFVSGVRNAIALSKKLTKLAKTIKDPLIDNLRAFLDATLPMAHILEVLKTKTIKGRKPNPEAAAKKAAQLANKTLRTCACCFREIAVLGNGMIADHGYTLPQKWMKTASCPGRMFKPLEVSNDGLVYMVDRLTKQVAGVEKALANAPNVTTLLKASYSNKVGTPVNKGEPGWDRLYQQHVTELTNDLDAAQGALTKFKKLLADWQPVQVESLAQMAVRLRELVS